MEKFILEMQKILKIYQGLKYKFKKGMKYRIK